MKNTKITIRLDNTTHETLINKANASNRNISEFIRNAILTTQISVNNTKDKGKLIGAINRVGNNINQIAHNLNIAKQNNDLKNVDYETIINQLYIIETSINKILNKDFE